MPSAVFSDARFRLDYSVSTVRQEIENNRSLVRTVLTIVKTGSSYAFSGNVSSYGSTYQGGTFTYDFGSYSSLTLVNREDWVGHNADGTKTISLSAWVNADTPLGSASIGSFNYTLATIPRATTPTVSGGFTTGAAATINLPRASSNFTHDVSWSIGSKGGTIAAGAGVTAAWTPPHDLMTELPNAATGSIKLSVVTKSGATVIGTKDVMIPVTAGAAVVPTVSAVLWDDANTTVKTNIGAFVQGASLIKGAVTAAGIHGSSIASKQVMIAGALFPENQTFQVNSSGTVVASGEVTDSRGRSASKAANFTVLPYEVPKLGANMVQVRRANAANVADDNGQYIRVDLHAIASSLKPASVEKNALTIAVRTRPLNGAWTNRQTINPGLTHNTAFQVTGGAVFLVSQSYEVELTITDKTGVAPIVIKSTVGTAVVSLHLVGGKAGVGKYNELGTLDVAGDIYSSGVRVARVNELAVPATEAIVGLVRRASQGQVNGGVDTGGYVSPATLKGWSVEHVAGRPAIPVSIEVTAGTASVREDGLITFSGVPILHLNGIFEAATDSAYKMVVAVTNAVGQPVYLRSRSNGVTMTSTYNRLANSIQYASGPIRAATFGTTAAAYVKPANGAAGDAAIAEVTFFKTSAPGAGSTRVLMSSYSSESGDRRFWQEHADFSGSHDGLSMEGGTGASLSGWLRVWKVA